MDELENKIDMTWFFFYRSVLDLDFQLIKLHVKFMYSEKATKFAKSPP